MRFLACFALLAAVGCSAMGCSAREEAVATTTLNSAELPNAQPIALIGETKSGLRVNVEQSGRVEDSALTLAHPAKLTLRRGEQVLAFRADADAKSRMRGAVDFAAHTIAIVTKDTLEQDHDGDAGRFVEAFSDALYGDAEHVAPPALTPGWNALVLITESGQTQVETLSLRKVRR